MMKLKLIPAILFAAITVATNGQPTTTEETEIDCLGKIIQKEYVTKLDFNNSILTSNTLHLPDGELRYENIGTVRDRPVDLVVTVADGDYTDIKEVWDDRGKDPAFQNGKKPNSQFGKINLQTVQGKPKSGEGNFRFCFHDHANPTELVTVDTFRFTVYDTDERGFDGDTTSISAKEKLLVDVNQVRLYQLWPDMTNSQIKLSCEDKSSFPCRDGTRTVFHSSKWGNGADNPSDPNNMTNIQKERTVTFTFVDTDCFEFTYDHYCPADQPDYTGEYDKCKGYNGGNFLFSGDSDEIISEGECITSKPTPEPEPTDSSCLGEIINGECITTPEETETESPIVIDPCPEDVKVLHTHGSTKFPDGVVNILRQNKTSVTVDLFQEWTGEKPLKSIFYAYEENIFTNKCYEETNVDGNSRITGDESITIACNVLSPIAYLEICIVDELSNGILSSNDDGTVPECCHSETPPNTLPTVCYTLQIRCESICEQKEERRMLRRRE